MAAPVTVPDGVPAPTTPPPAPQQHELETRAQEFVAQERFNRRFTLPATDAHDELTVTYAVGGVDSDTAPTLLFIGGLYGGRRLATVFDYVAQSLGMRVVVVDRPGMGGSTFVEISLRLSVWLETVPLLLDTIKARHVYVAAHSCGAIYALNTVYEFPWILPPSNRKLYLFSPWVNLEHSGLSMLSISSHLPSPLINKFDSVVRCANSIIAPTTQFSSLVSGAVTASFTGEDQGDGRRKPLPRHERDEVCWEYCGISAAENSVRSREIMRALFKESTRGANHDVLLSLRKGVAGGWGAFDDCSTYPDSLEARMREVLHHQETRSDLSSGLNTGGNDVASVAYSNPLVITTLWAEKDDMVDKRGEAYFNKCFEHYSEPSGGSVGSGGTEDKCLLYRSEVLPETVHNTVFLPQYEGFPRALRDMLGR